MNTIKLRIEYSGKVLLNGEEHLAPITMTWFEKNDLIIDTLHERIIFNTDAFKPVVDNVYIVSPQKVNDELEIIPDVELKLVKNNVAVYLVINNKYTVRMPEIIKTTLPL